MQVTCVTREPGCLTKCCVLCMSRGQGSRASGSSGSSSQRGAWPEGPCHCRGHESCTCCRHCMEWCRSLCNQRLITCHSGSALQTVTCMGGGKKLQFLLACTMSLKSMSQLLHIPCHLACFSRLLFPALLVTGADSAGGCIRLPCKAGPGPGSSKGRVRWFGLKLRQGWGACRCCIYAATLGGPARRVSDRANMKAGGDRKLERRWPGWGWRAGHIA